jgi:uncharacterized damage-inducible protein DinB
MEAAMTLRQVLLEEAEATYSIAERLFRRVADEELAWTPATGGNWMSIGQLLMHCASFSCGKAIQGFVEGDWGLPEDSGIDALKSEDHVPPAAALPSVVSLEQALELLARDRRLAASCIEAAAEGNLLDRSVAAPWGGPEVSLFQHLLHMVAHLAQHKGQLFYYLKLMGKDVDTGDLWGT